ncbi:glycoside hydrolase family protein [Flavobacterium gelidilacus]|uniref:glycoside hydrolase family protein n=1 Tax=Flavobacterium gelidilacus TaxID=206041 RepID=UPI0003FEC8D2|nr:glycoside hydrolase family protein [Flavobacterium gelidilacus]
MPIIDNNGIKIEKASWGQTVNIYLKTEYLIGEEINIEVWDDDTFFDDGVANKSIKIYDGKPISLKLDKNVKNKTGTLGKLYVKVFAPKLTLLNQGKGFPGDGLIVEDVMSFSNAIIGEENGSKKHTLVDYDDVSWFYANTTGIKGYKKLFIAVYQKLTGEKPEFLAKLENITLSEDGVLKAKIDWKKVPKIKQVRVVYIQVKDEKYKVLYSANAAVDKALTTLQFSPTAVKMVENKAAVVVGTQALQGSSCGEKYCIKKDDTSELIREVSIRLAGFGGNVPTDVFTDRTEKMIKQFQRDYMKVPETGKICGNVLKAIDDFSLKFDLSTTQWSQIKCSCGTKGQKVTSTLREIKELNSCAGFGDNTGKGTYKTGNEEKNHKYEYPGIHRSLLFGFKTLLFYLSKNETYKFREISSGYRCRFKNFTTTNHQGKALDIQFNKDSWEIRGAEKRNIAELGKIRDDIFHKYFNAKTSWINGKNNFCLEPIDLIYKANGKIDKNYTYSWIHFDVREFDSIYLDDKYFCKNKTSLNGKSIVAIAKELGFDKTCACFAGFSSQTNSQSTNTTDRVDPKTLKLSEKGKQFIKDWEDFRADAYNDSEGYCTIGYGHLIKKKKCEDIIIPTEFKNGITKEKATKLFDARLVEFENAVKRDITATLYQYKYDALVSLVFNTGPNFLNTGGAKGGETKIKKNINNNEYSAGADEMADVTNGGTTGLVKRRKAEINTFKNNIYDSTH